MYDPRIGRFLSEDPTGMADGPNAYTYAHNDPVNGADPAGLATKLLTGVASGVGTAVAGAFSNFLPGADFLNNVLRPAGTTALGAVAGMQTSAVSDYLHWNVVGGYYSGLAQGATNVVTGAAGLVKEVGLTIADGVGLTADAAGEVVGYPLKYQVRSSVGKAYDPNRSWQSQTGERAVHTGITAATLGSSEIVGGLYEYSQTGDADAFSQRMGGMALGNLLGARAMRASPVRSNAQLVQDIAFKAEAWGNRKGLTGTPQSIGTAKHVHARDLLNRYQDIYGNRGLSTEVRYVNQDVWLPGKGMPTKGSVILDVVDGPLTSPRAIYDYKFGTRGLSVGRTNQIRTATGFENTVILEVRPR
jgi:hypothetical protein